MATQSVVLSAEFEEYAAELVREGRYASSGEVLRAAMDALKREECSEEAKENYLRQALEDGEASGIYEGDAFADIRREMGWEPKA